MKLLPEIDPEVRGLLEEIVSDPRSSIRFAPRKPLKSWFDSGETVRARDVSGTTAERHLIEAHREALAKLLYEGAMIAYWMAPTFSLLPFGDDGRPRLLESEIRAWSSRSRSRLEKTPADLPGTEILRLFAGEMRPTLGLALAQASLGLVPSDRARYGVAVTLPKTRMQTSVKLLRSLKRSHLPVELRHRVHESIGARLSNLAQVAAARAAYRDATLENPDSLHGHVYAFNLSCFLGDENAATEEAIEIGSRLACDHPLIHDAGVILRSWWKTQGAKHVEVARHVAARMSGKIPDAAEALGRTFKS